MKYSLETLELFKKLANINPKIIIENIGDHVYVRSRNPSGTVYYTLKTTKENFEFPTEKLHFLNFVDFYSSFKVLSNKNSTPKIEFKTKEDFNYLELSTEESKMGIVLDNGELFRNEEDCGIADLGEYKVVGVTKQTLEKDAWCVERHKRFKTMVSNITGTNPSQGTIRVSSEESDDPKGAKICLDILNDRQYNSFKEYVPNTISGESFEFIFTKHIFTDIPDGDYVMTIYENGGLEMEMVINEDTSLVFQSYRIES